VLFQLPPNLKVDLARLAAFLSEAKALRLRMAFEFRHPTWFEAATWKELEKAGAAVCIAESDELVTPDVVTADFACYRLRQAEYPAERLAEVAARLSERAARGGVFAYFKHEDEPTGALRASKVLAMVRDRAS